MSTEGFTSDNINELIEKVQEQMLAALKDISTPLHSSPTSSTATIHDTTAVSKNKPVALGDGVDADSDASDETEVEESVSDLDGEVPASEPGKVALA